MKNNNSNNSNNNHHNHNNNNNNPLHPLQHNKRRIEFMSHLGSSQQMMIEFPKPNRADTLKNFWTKSPPEAFELQLTRNDYDTEYGRHYKTRRLNGNLYWFDYYDPQPPYAEWSYYKNTQ